MRATAPYRFVRLNDVVIPTPLSDTDIATIHSHPIAGGLSAVLDVEWLAETPLLIGQDEGRRETSEPGEAGTFGPMMLAGKYVIPGSSLRGMLRSTFEILTFARLRQLNAHHRYGTRDFNKGSYFHERMLGAQAGDNIGAGWLRRDEASGEIFLRPCNWAPIAIAELCGGPSRVRDWRNKELSSKYEFLNRGRVGTGGEVLAWNDQTARRFVDAAEHDGLSLHERTGLVGHLVVSGKATNENANKHYEYVFFEPEDDECCLHPVIFENFDLIHSKPAKNARTPEGSWAVMKPLFDSHQPIPVFYRKEHKRALEEASAQAVSKERAGQLIQLGLTRLFKLPAELSVGQVLRHTPCHRFGPDDRLDMADALFGYVDEVGDRWQADMHSKDAKLREQSPASMLRSRIAFGLAKLTNPEVATTTEAQDVIMMGPRASFSPFYLVGGRLDYSARAFRNGTPYLAGRKRYPARFPTGETALDEQSLGRALAATLRDPDGKLLSGETRSRLRFLTGRPGEALRFKGKIKLHNVHPVELGAVLWSLMLLDPAQPTERAARHMIGRGKPFGCGQVRVETFGLRVRANDAAAEKLVLPGPTAGWMTEAPDNVQPLQFLAEFLEYADRHLARGGRQSWKERLELRDLLATASPSHNHSIAQATGSPNVFAYLDRDRDNQRVAGHKAHAAYKRWSEEDESQTSVDVPIRRLRTDG